MEVQRLLATLHVAERLKDETRHCYTSGGRHESVAEHSWRAALMAWLLKDEFPDVDIHKVIVMCLIHDLGEAFTGDIPAFLKTDVDEQQEDDQLRRWVATLPQPYCSELQALYAEMAALETTEARLYKAIDGMEAVLQHNESDLATWIPGEYSLNRTYAEARAAFSPYLQQLRRALRDDTDAKLRASGIAPDALGE